MVDETSGDDVKIDINNQAEVNDYDGTEGGLSPLTRGTIKSD